LVPDKDPAGAHRTETVIADRGGNHQFVCTGSRNEISKLTLESLGRADNPAQFHQIILQGTILIRIFK
jgi:hypothetical protein